DGQPEVIVEGGILDGATGAIKATFSQAMIGTFAVSDVDADGKLDIVSGSQVYGPDGVLRFSTGATGYAYPDARILTGGPAIADLDHDGIPEVIAVYFATHQMAVWHYDPTKAEKFSFVRTGIDINGPFSESACPGGSHGNKNGGGPATVGDFNADGTPDVALAGGVGYAVLDGQKLMDASVAPADTFLFVKPTQDCSSAGTGSSLFDFDGDGKVEVVYGDERKLRIYEGATGTVLWETCNTTGTLSEYPVIADVDNDGEADIVAVSNAFGAAHGQAYFCDGTMTAGVRVFSSKAGTWVRTRRTWNEHAYHVTNVNEDGSIPAVEPTNWKDPLLNNFRQNKQPGQEFSAPDVVISLLSPACDEGAYGLVATVRNIGESVLPPGVPVGFYLGSVAPSNLLGTGTTTLPLYPAQAERRRETDRGRWRSELA
ncbi:MAG: VCBS repeat-containing protein, partial [Myxococcales bacterium]